jgi:acyl-CoA thioester hydrolase
MNAPNGFRHFQDVRVRYAETDAQGIVYHSNYLIFCEVARIEYFRAMNAAGEGGAPWKSTTGYDVVLVHASCDYRSSARFDDRLRVFLRAAAVGRSSLTFEYKIVKHDGTDGVLVCDAKTVQASIRTETRRSTPWPAEFVTRIQRWEETGEAHRRI